MSWMLTRWYRFPLLFIAVSVLQSCGGGGGGGGGGGNPPVVPNADPTGYYINSGSASVIAGNGTTSVNITDLQGVIHNNRLVMFSAAQGLSYDGILTINGNDFTGTVTVYDNGAMRTTGVAISGTIDQGTTVTGTIAGTAAGSGTFALNYAANNSEAAALSSVGRSSRWNGDIGGSTGADFAMFIDPATGNIIDEFSATTGVFRDCRITGVITPISGTHLYAVNITLSRCHATTAAAEGSYTGLAATRTEDPATPNDRLFFTVTNGTFSVGSEFF